MCKHITMGKPITIAALIASTFNPLQIHAKDNYVADQKLLAKEFHSICLWETRDKMNSDAYNKAENARGPAQIRPIYLVDANEYLKRKKLRTYSHIEMHSYQKAFIVYCAYVTRYNLKTTEHRIRCHNGGPTGYKKKATINYYKQVMKRFNRLK